MRQSPAPRFTEHSRPLLCFGGVMHTTVNTKWRVLAVGVALLATGTLPAGAQSPEAEARRLAGSDSWRTDFGRTAVPLSEIVSGGPPKDGIPALDRPSFESAEEADGWLGDSDPVVIVEHGRTVKGYPLGILIWHEIVNDFVGDLPVTITFCPLCNTALAFDRRLDGRVLDFGTTGRLRHSDLVMYDRQTETWWQQAVGEAIVGELVGRRLTYVPANTLGWAEVKRLYPAVEMLSRDTGFPDYRSSGRYGQNPYAGYDSRSAPYPRFFAGAVDAGLPAMDRVAALDLGDGGAVSFRELERSGVVNADFEGRAFAVFWAPGAASALDERRIARGRDVGQSVVFDRRAGGRTLAFEPAEGGFRDRETGSTWNLAGLATAGPLADERLTPMAHGNHFWFAWIAFRPNTEVWRP
jgi:hypothetical protein